MYLTPEEYEEKWLAPMRRKQRELAFGWIDERIKRFQEHCRRKEGQQVRWFMERHRARIREDGRVFVRALTDVMAEFDTGERLIWQRSIANGKWRQVPESATMLSWHNDTVRRSAEKAAAKQEPVDALYLRSIGAPEDMKFDPTQPMPVRELG